MGVFLLGDPVHIPQVFGLLLTLLGLYLINQNKSEHAKEKVQVA